VPVSAGNKLRLDTRRVVPHYLCRFVGADLINPVAPQPDGRRAGRSGGLGKVELTPITG
jgi:hypothetical protein